METAVLELIPPVENTGVITGKAKGYANLKPRWKKGECPNPGGRPKTHDIREKVLEHFRKDPEAVIRKVYNERIDLFLAYGFGKPVDRLELSGPNGGQIEVHQTSAEDSVKALAAMGIVLPG